jgi:hypothetical protein
MGNNKKWYNIELPYNNDSAINKVHDFKKWLVKNNYKYESSISGTYNHIEILLSINDLSKVNNALDAMMWEG